MSPTNFGTYGSSHTKSLVTSKTKPPYTISTHAITFSKPCHSTRKVIAFANNIGYPMRKAYGKGYDGEQA